MPAEYYCSVAILRDVTDQRKAEEALKESEEKFSKIFQSSPVGMVMTHLPDARCTDVNESYLKMIEYSSDEVIGRDSNELNIHPDPNRRVQLLKVLSEEGKITNFEIRARTKTGRIMIP